MKAFIYSGDEGSIRVAGPIPDSWGDLGGSAFEISEILWNEYIEKKEAFEVAEDAIIKLAKDSGAKPV